MNYNKIFVPSTGLDPIKFVSIVAFAKYCKNDLCKLVIDGFRNAGKVAEYVRKHMLASYCFGENWTKYGYSDHNNYFLLSRKDAAVVAKMIADKKATRRPYNPEREKAAWARRLAKLTDITEDEARELANLGIIDRGDVKEYARQHTHHYDF